MGKDPNSKDPSPPAHALVPLPHYDVGYGKPPVTSRFKPGQSGNPRGRPKGARNRLPALNDERLKTIVLQEAYRTIKVRDGNRNMTVPMAQAIIRTLAVNAAKGNNRAALIFSTLLQTTERENRELHDQWLRTAIDYKTGWEKILAHRKAHGIVAPDPIPHPDDIVIDHRSGTVKILGPMTREDKQAFDEAQTIHQDLARVIAWSQRRLKRERDPAKRQALLDAISEDTELGDRLASLMPRRYLSESAL